VTVVKNVKSPSSQPREGQCTVEIVSKSETQEDTNLKYLGLNLGLTEDFYTIFNISKFNYMIS
jgi:hypothetical protein